MSYSWSGHEKWSLQTEKCMNIFGSIPFPAVAVTIRKGWSEGGGAAIRLGNSKYSPMSLGNSKQREEEEGEEETPAQANGVRYLVLISIPSTNLSAPITKMSEYMHPHLSSASNKTKRSRYKI